MLKVSVIIPVYNVEQYLSQCLDSVVGQSYQNLEVILVDDGSTDGSKEICDYYAEKDERIRLIRQKNQGAANAKNTGLHYVTGELITFIDSDDYVENNWIERMVFILERENADLVECSFVLEYTDRVVPGNDDSFCYKVFNSEEYMAQYLDNWTCSLFWNKLFRKELTEKIYFRRERRCIDDEFYTYKILTNADKIVRISDQLYHYRQRRSGAVASEKNQLQKTDDALEILIERYKWIVTHFPALNHYYLKHDIEIMSFFAKSFLFEKKTVKKFRHIAMFYLRKCICNRMDFATFKNALQINLIKKCLFLSTQYKMDEHNMESYYP